MIQEVYGNQILHMLKLVMVWNLNSILLLLPMVKNMNFRVVAVGFITKIP